MDIHNLYAKLNRQFRARRMHRFAEAFGIDSRTRILDLGGSHYIWMMLPVRPKLVLLNLLPDKEHGDDFTDVIGDARHLPFKDKLVRLGIQQLADRTPLHLRRAAAVRRRLPTGCSTVLHPVTEPALLSGASPADPIHPLAPQNGASATATKLHHLGALSRGQLGRTASTS